MAAPGTSYASTGGTAAPAPDRAPAKQAAAQRVQRYYNKASGRMETAQQMRGYRPPTQMHPVPAGHQVSHTQTTTHTAGPAHPAARPEVSFINMTPREIEARAKAIVAAELKANREPFQQEQRLLGQEQTYGLNRNTEQFGKLGQTIEQQQNTQAGTAKTFENYAADQVNKAQSATPGLAQTQERLGIPAGGKLPESVQRQQEASRTLLSGIAQAAQSGTTARQEAESNFLTNMRAAAAQQGVETGRNIEAQYGRQKAGVAGKEAALVARAGGTQSNLILKMLEEQQKSRIAAEGLGLKGIQTEQKGEATRSKIKTERAKVSQGQQKIAQGNVKLKNEAEYKKATVAEKKRQDEIKNAQGWARIKQAGERNAAKTGLKVSTPAGLKKSSEELSGAFTTFERLRSGGELEDWPAIRQKLAAGQEPGRGTVHYYKGKAVGESEGKRIKIPKVADGVLVRAAEEAWRYHGFSNQTMQQLAHKGLSFGSQREAYEVIAGRPYTPPQRTPSGVRGGAK